MLSTMKIDADDSRGEAYIIGIAEGIIITDIIIYAIFHRRFIESAVNMILSHVCESKP